MILVLPLALAGSAPLLLLALHPWWECCGLELPGLTQVVLPGQSHPVMTPLSSAKPIAFIVLARTLWLFFFFFFFCK